MENNYFLKRVYDATRGGLDIITDLLPAVDDAVINLKKAFRLRPDERTPSAHLYPPDQKYSYWHVKDFGWGEDGGFFSPIDLYMWDRGYSKDKFRMALEELAEHYGVQELLSRSTNMPVIEKRDARPEEMGEMPRITLAKGLDGIDLSCWGANVKPEHLQTYGWHGVTEVAITYGDKVVVRKPTPTYPILPSSATTLTSRDSSRPSIKSMSRRTLTRRTASLLLARSRSRSTFMVCKPYASVFRIRAKRNCPFC